MRLSLWGKSEWQKIKLTSSKEAFERLKSVVEWQIAFKTRKNLLIKEIEKKLNDKVSNKELKQFLIRLQRDLRCCHSTPEAEKYAQMYLSEEFSIKIHKNSPFAKHWNEFYGFITIKIV